VAALTLLLSWLLGHIRWPEPVGLAMIRLSAALGGQGIEDTEDLFLLLSVALSFAVAVAVVMLAERRQERRTMVEPFRRAD
jgi:hypothetical protein